MNQRLDVYVVIRFQICIFDLLNTAGWNVYWIFGSL